MIQNEMKKLGILADVGAALVTYSESIAEGGKFELSGSRWVVRPNNFVTFEPHYLRVLNIAVSLRGNPSEYAELPELPLKQGMSGYSECTITKPDQLAAAAFYIRRAYELFQRGRNRTQKKQILIET
ncbi:hypothetical protein [Neptunomonas phycophila]|uniref:hypothetical protein n=1 Tax=Neptunomonas phycophila TaxID=1572645 RepID=UPI0015BCE5FB|nr:hypothetical protein [Neptunomonas phycophila]QLE97786.1 hypothetical protein FLM49_09180 [Neptunomonas phycophila]